MNNLLEQVNLFPYTQLWRVKGRDQVSYVCGGIVSVLLMFIIIAIAVVEFVKVFQMNTINFTSQSSINFTSPLTTITTYQNNPNLDPYMFAINPRATIPGQIFFQDSDWSVTARYLETTYNPVTAESIYKSTSLTLQPCTADHFSRIQGVYQYYKDWGINSWVCLPINMTLEIGQIGGGLATAAQKKIVIDIFCITQACNDSTTSSMLLTTYSLNSFPNPSNSGKPFTAYLYSKQTAFQSRTISKNIFGLDTSVMITDSSLLPTTSQSTRQSFTLNDAVNTNNIVSPNPHTIYSIQRSSKTITINRSYMKLLDALSFIGGIFNVLLGIFFFMNGFGRAIYEMQFVRHYFKRQSFFTINIFSYFKDKLYNIITAFKLELDWQQSKYRLQFKKTINNLLDIVFLQKRLQFLQKTLTILFQKHQLKGLYLLHYNSKEEIDYNIRNYRIRNRLIYYFQKKQQYQQYKMFSTILMGSPDKNQILINDKQNKNNLTLKKDENNPDKLVEKESDDNWKSIQMQNERIRSKKDQHSRIQSAVQLTHSKKSQLRKMQSAVQLNRHQQQLKNDQVQNMRFRDWPLDYIQQNQRQEDQQFLLTLQQLQKLSIQANSKDGNPISKKIFKSIDKQLQIRLEQSRQNSRLIQEK